MSTTPATPAEPALTTDATEDALGPPGAGTTSGPSGRGRLHGFRALRHPGFRLYFGAMLLRGMAMWMPLVAIPWVAVQLGATPAEVGIVSACFFLPTLFIGPLGGVLADRVERLRVLVVAQLVAALVATVMFLIVAAGLETLPLLALVSVAFGMVVSLEVPVRQAFMTELVPHRDIPSAASLHAMAFNTTRLLGPVLAGLMIASISSAAPFIYGTISSVIVILAVLRMDRYRAAGRQRADRSNSVLHDLREGAAFALGEPVVRWSLLLVSAMATFGIATFITLAPLYAPDELGLAADGYGAFIGALGAGGLTSAVLVTAFAHGDRRPWLIVGVFSMAVLMAGIALAQVVAVAFASAFLLGAAQIALGQNALVSVQSSVPDMLRGRVMGIWVMNFQASSLFGAIIAGGLAELAGVRGAMFVSAAVLGCVGVVAFVGLRRATWRLRHTEAHAGGGADRADGTDDPSAAERGVAAA